VNASEQTYGPYAVGNKEYNLAPLITRRYQSFIRVFTSLPLTLLYQAWSDFQTALQAKVPSGAEEAEVTLTNEDMAPLGAAVSQMVIQADEGDTLVSLLAIALGIDTEEAAEIPYAVGLEAISDFFTANPSLLPDSVRFLTGMVNPMRRSLQTQVIPETSPPQKPNSASTPSPPKPEESAEETGRVRTPEMDTAGKLR